MQCDIFGGICHVLLLYRLHYFDVLRHKYIPSPSPFFLYLLSTSRNQRYPIIYFEIPQHFT